MPNVRDVSAKSEASGHEWDEPLTGPGLAALPDLGDNRGVASLDKKGCGIWVRLIDLVVFVV